MIKRSHIEGREVIEITPNRSMTWQDNKKIVMSLLVLSSIISVSLGLAGAWLVLPFAGLEMLALSFALYYVCWKLNYCEVLRVSSTHIDIEKGIYRPKKTWHWPKEQVNFFTELGQHEWDAPKVTLNYQEQWVSLAAELSKDDVNRLIGELKSLGFFFRSSQLSNSDIV